MGEEFLGHLGRLGDRDRGGERELAEQIVDLLELEPHPALHPGRAHQLLVLGAQVDRRDQAAGFIQQAAGAGEEDDLVRLQRRDQFVRRDIGIEVEDLAARRFAQARDDRDGAGLEAGLDRAEKHARHLADQAELAPLEIIGLEHAADDRAGARAHCLQRFDQLEVLRMEHAPHDRQCRGRGNAQAIDDRRVDTGLGQLLVELRSGAVDHDRGQPDLLQEGERRNQAFEMVLQDRAADFHHREARRIELRKALEVLLDLLGARHVGEQPHDGIAQFLVGVHVRRR